MNLPYQDRVEAGRVLGEALSEYKGRRDLLILALPRGGVPVAAEVAETLDAPLDLMLVRKLGVPGQEELAMGAIASGGRRVLNPEVVEALQISNDVIERVASREREELNRREHAYRGERSPPEIEGHCVILIDDGLATGSTMLAAVDAVRQRNPSRTVVAVPVAPPETIDGMRGRVDDIVCPAAPALFGSVGRWYVNFAQTTDAEVRHLLERSWSREHADRRA